MNEDAKLITFSSYCFVYSVVVLDSKCVIIKKKITKVNRRHVGSRVSLIVRYIICTWSTYISKIEHTQVKNRFTVVIHLFIHLGIRSKVLPLLMNIERIDSSLSVVAVVISAVACDQNYLMSLLLLIETIRVSFVEFFFHDDNNVETE